MQDSSVAVRDCQNKPGRNEIESTRHNKIEMATKTTAQTEENPVEDEEEDMTEYVIDRIVSNRKNEEAKHPRKNSERQ